MTKREKLVVSAYTGVLMADINELRKFITEVLKRPVYTDELGNPDTLAEIKNAVKSEFLSICKSPTDQVVRCKDCRYLSKVEQTEYCKMGGFDGQPSVDTGVYYCFYGEERS